MTATTWIMSIIAIIAIIIIIILIIVFASTKSKDDKIITDYKNQIESLNNELTKLKDQLSSPQNGANVEALNTKITKLQQQLEDCYSSSSSNPETTINGDLSSIKTQLESSKNELENCNTLNSDLKKQLSDCLAKIDNATISLANALKYDDIYVFRRKDPISPSQPSYIRHFNFLGVTDPFIINAQGVPINGIGNSYIEDTQYKARNILMDPANIKAPSCTNNGPGKPLSLESVNFPSHYISSRDNRLVVEKILPTDPLTKKENASWCEVCNDGSCFYEHANSADPMYINQKEGTKELWIGTDKTLFERLPFS